MKLLDAKTSKDLVRLVVFVVVTSLATGLLVILIGNISFGEREDFKAVFTDATGVVKGDDVRVAGVKVGSVSGIEIVEQDQALVSFDVSTDVPMTGRTFATVRYRNLVGQRYIALTEEIGDDEELDPGATIPVSRTKPALDLTLLFNGFKPLFKALTPEDVNQLSYEIVQTFQGEGGTLESLLGSTASLTRTLADRDQVIGDLLDNLDYVLDHIADRDEQLSELILSFRRLVGGLKDDRQAILGSLDDISRLSVETAGLAEGIRPPLVRDIKELRRLSGNINANKAELDRALQVLPIKLTKVGRTAIYGSWFNFYLCEFKGRVLLPELPVGGIPGVPSLPESLPLDYSTNAERCDLG